MYHPSRGGVRGGRDQFNWDDVKVDKHRENYLGHSIKAPVGRWQKGKDLHWYTRDKKSAAEAMEAAKEEIKRIKEGEEQAMREALGLAPKQVIRPRGNRLDKHEYAELVKRESVAEDIGGGHAEAAQLQGIGLYKIPCNNLEESSSMQDRLMELPSAEKDHHTMPEAPILGCQRLRHADLGKETSRNKRRHDERRDGERTYDRHEKKSSHNSDDHCKHHKGKERRRHDSG